MKQILLSLLTCGICVSAFTQIDSSKKINPGNPDKWEIIKGSAKSSTGKLFVTLPKGTEWDMTIYATGTTKVLSNTSLKTSLTLQPGTYDLQINHIWIKGVPVEKGNETRLKAGVLHVTTPDSWTLYDETQKTVLINSLSPQERGLPIGKYKLTILGQVQDIEITDEYTSPPGLQVIDTPGWIITPLQGSEDALLDLSFPGDTSWHMKISSNGSPDILLSADDFKNNKIKSGGPFPGNSYSLTPGKYNITLNRLLLEGVLIISGRKTRIKTGLLKINAQLKPDSYYHDTGNPKLQWYLYPKTNDSYYDNPYFISSGSRSVALPVKEYGIKIMGVYPVNRVVITDRKTTSLEVVLGVVKITNYPPKPWSLRDASYTYVNGNPDTYMTVVELPIGTYRLHFGPNGSTAINKDIKEGENFFPVPGF